MKKGAFTMSLVLMTCLLAVSGTSFGREGKHTTSPPTKPQCHGILKIPCNPVFFPEGGVYKRTIKVVILSPDPRAKIYYTLDGTTPTTDSQRFKRPITLRESTVVRAMSVDKKGNKYYAMTGYEFDLDRRSDASSRMSSPQWRDQIIYFAMIDRFANGDLCNDNLGYNENAPVEGRFNGGDLQGLTDKLDYIKELGASAIWITPPVKNAWTDGNYGGYHGYWASDFMSVDPHFGDLATYQQFVLSAHSKGMYVIQDIVVNHTGDFMRITEPLKFGDFTDKFSFTPGSVPTRPDSVIWRMNDPRVLTEDEFNKYSFYHWNPLISDYNNPDQAYNFQASDLDDMNTDNPVVQNLLQGYFRYWIDKVDVDGYRIDTARYVKPEFFEKFINNKCIFPFYQGIKVYANRLGKSDFFSFGEVWDTSDQVCAQFTQGPEGQKRLDSTLYFPLTFTLRGVVSTGQPTVNLTETLNARYTSGYADPDRLVTFVDNHDMERLLNSTDPELVKAAYGLIMTINGIPQIYYGSEQGFTLPRAAMFKGGYKTNGQTNASDLYNQNGPWWDYFKGIINLRKTHRVFRYNELNVICDTKTGPGLFSYTLKETDTSGQATSGILKEAFYVMNTSGGSKVLTADSQLEPGDQLTLLQPSSPNMPNELIVGKDGKIATVIPGKSYGIYLLTAKNAPNPIGDHTITITSSYPQPLTDNVLSISGTVSVVNSTVKVVIDGNYDSAVSIVANGQNWQADLNLAGISAGEHQVRAILDTNVLSTIVSSEPVSFQVQNSFSIVAELSDPEGDDTGPAGKNYALPIDISFTGHPQDIKGVKVWRAGSDFWIDVTMKQISRVWSPTLNDFDHVSFEIFISDGDADGVTVNPNHNHTLPEGMLWDYMIAADGWNMSMFSKEGADAVSNGTSITPAPTTEVFWAGSESELANGVIRFKVSADSIGNPGDITGWKLYIATWDTDMGKPRRLLPEPNQWAFSGGDDTQGDPLVMDETGILTIASTNQVVAEAVDPEGDDTGPTSKAYVLPTNASFNGHPQDIKHVKVWRAGSDLWVDITMKQLSRAWSPTVNPFDHVSFNIFISDGDADGATVNPFHNTEVPSGMKWDYMVVAEGWSSGMYSKAGAEATSNGSSIIPAPTAQVTWTGTDSVMDDGVIRFKISGASLGNPTNFTGWQVYIAAWDMDMGKPRRLLPESTEWSFSGGDDTQGDPLVIDDTVILTLSANGAETAVVNQPVY